MLGLGQDHDPNVPQRVDGHLDARQPHDAFIFSAPSLHSAETCCVTVTHLFKADVCDVPQDALHRVRPFLLAQRILLSPDDVEIMRDVVGGVVSCLSLTLTVKPGVDVGGRTGIPCRFMWK